MFHMYAGVRAGGGIGDEIEDPAGDEFEFYRIIFDITFFFFVIVILLAIIQGKRQSNCESQFTEIANNTWNEWYVQRISIRTMSWSVQFWLFSLSSNTSHAVQHWRASLNRSRSYMSRGVYGKRSEDCKMLEDCRMPGVE